MDESSDLAGAPMLPQPPPPQPSLGMSDDMAATCSSSSSSSSTSTHETNGASGANHVSRGHLANGPMGRTLFSSAASSLPASEAAAEPPQLSAAAVAARLDALPTPVIRGIATFHGHSKAVTCAEFSPNGRFLATASADSSVLLWDLTTLRLCGSLVGLHRLGVNALAWSPSSEFIATASDDSFVGLWDVATQRPLRVLRAHSNHVSCVHFHPHGHLLASGSFDETVCLWDVVTGACVRQIDAHSEPVTAVHFAPDGTLLLSAAFDGLCRLWDTHTGFCLRTISGGDKPAPVGSACFTPNGKFVLATYLNSTARLFAYTRIRQLKTYTGHVNTRFVAPVAVPSWRRVPGAREYQPFFLGSEDGLLQVFSFQRSTPLCRAAPVAESGADNAATGKERSGIDPATGNGASVLPEALVVAASADRKPSNEEEAKGATGPEESKPSLQPLAAVATHPFEPVLATVALPRAEGDVPRICLWRLQLGESPVAGRGHGDRDEDASTAANTHT